MRSVAGWQVKDEQGEQVPRVAAPVPGHHRAQGGLQGRPGGLLDVREWIFALSGERRVEREGQ